VKRVGLVAHPTRPAAKEAAERLERWFEQRRIDVVRTDGTNTEDEIAAAAFARDLDLVVAVGGDGTFLRAAHLASRGDVAILGVKVGRMGFLTEVEPEHAGDLLQRIVEGRARIEERMAMLAEPHEDAFPSQWALNEVIVEKTARHRLIRLAVYVDEIYVTTFSADGVITATPTGSTAYSFSAGGPIVTPSVSCIVVTPIAPHMVFDRSLVLGADQRVTIAVLGDEAAVVSADGRASLEVPVGSRVRIGRAPKPARFVRLDDAPPFHELVRRKFDLPGSHPHDDPQP
jgi:NAD+ kinase